jgi:hypothetical protein
MKRRNVYLLLCLAGVVIPYWQVVPWLLEHGLNPSLLFEQLFVNKIAAFFGADVIVSAVVVFAFVGFERRRLGSNWWLPPLAVLIFGVSAGLPLLLFLLEGPEQGSVARHARA